MNRGRLLRRIAGGALHNVAFSDLLDLAHGFGFHVVRTSGDHHILAHPDLPKLLSLQSVKAQAKPYQIRQLLKLIEQYNLRLEDEE